MFSLRIKIHIEYRLYEKLPHLQLGDFNLCCLICICFIDPLYAECFLVSTMITKLIVIKNSKYRYDVEH